MPKLPCPSCNNAIRDCNIVKHGFSENVYKCPDGHIFPKEGTGKKITTIAGAAFGIIAAIIGFENYENNKHKLQ